MTTTQISFGAPSTLTQQLSQSTSLFTPNQTAQQTQPQQTTQQQQQATQQQQQQLNQINNIQSIYNSLHINKHTNIIKESARENVELNFKSFKYFLPKDSFISPKQLDQLYVLTTNIRKNLETKTINDSSLNIFLSQENINNLFKFTLI